MVENGKIRALVLTSGGLDSILTMYILARQRIDVIGIHMLTWFNIPKYSMLEDQPEHYISHGFKIYNIDISEEYTQILLHPKYGYGTSVNPCIDCKILFFSKARELLSKFNANFVASGEVLGQRPMTQNPQAMKLIERKSSLEGLLLRPLSAKLMKPTIPEENGWVNREELYDISGRGRKRQMEMARDFDITDYPSPGGGCLLTEKNFAPRFYDLIKHTDNVSVTDLLSLRYGRHFRISKRAKLIVGKNERENEFLKKFSWGNLRIDFLNVPGPYCLFDWDEKISSLKLALMIASYYSSYKKNGLLEVTIDVSTLDGNRRNFVVKPRTDLNVYKYMIA